MENNEITRQTWKKRLIRLAVFLAIGVVLVVLLYNNGDGTYLEKTEKIAVQGVDGTVQYEFKPLKVSDAARMWGRLSDATFIVGSFMAGFGLLMVIATTGFFDIIGYGLKSFWTIFTPFSREKHMPAFFDYKTQKAEHRGKTRWELFLVGVLMLVVSCIALLLFHKL